MRAENDVSRKWKVGEMRLLDLCYVRPNAAGQPIVRGLGARGRRRRVSIRRLKQFSMRRSEDESLDFWIFVFVASRFSAINVFRFNSERGKVLGKNRDEGAEHRRAGATGSVGPKKPNPHGNRPAHRRGSGS